MSDKRVATIYDYARFLNEVCHKTPRCNDCPLGGNNNGIGVTCSNLIKQYTDTYNDIILKWCDEHPERECKKCIHYEVCKGFDGDITEWIAQHLNELDECKFFKEKEIE